MTSHVEWDLMNCVLEMSEGIMAESFKFPNNELISIRVGEVKTEEEGKWDWGK